MSRDKAASRSRHLKLKYALLVGFVLLTLGRAVAGFASMSPAEAPLLVVLGVAGAWLIWRLAPSQYDRRIAAMTRDVALGTWVRNVKLTDDVQAWRALAVEDEGVRLLGRKGRPHRARGAGLTWRAPWSSRCAQVSSGTPASSCGCGPAPS